MKDPNSPIDYVLLFIFILPLGLLVVVLLQVRKPLYRHFTKRQFCTKANQWYFIGFIAIGVIMIIDFDRYQKLLGICTALQWYYLLTRTSSTRCRYN